MVAEESIKSVRINRLALVLLTVIATVVGLAPATLVLNRPQLLLYLAAGSVLIAALYSFMLESSATYSPGFLEFLLGGLGAVFPPALLGALSLILYGVIYYVTRLVESLAVWAGWQVQPNADLIAFYPTLILAALLGIALVLASENDMAGQLYPDTAGIKSAFYELLAQERRRLIGCTSAALLVLGVALAVFMAAGSTGKWFYVLLQFYLLFVSAPLSFLEAETIRSRAVEVISKFFEAAGYQVERFPRTDRPDVDPLLINLDLFTRKGGHNVFVEVKTASESTSPVCWRTAAGLKTATRALSEHLADLGQLDLSSDDVDSLLVLVDAQEDESLEAYCKDERIKLLRVSAESLREAVEVETSIEELQEAARRLLGVSAGPDDVDAWSASPRVGGDA